MLQVISELLLFPSRKEAKKMAIEMIGKVYKTDDLSIFKTLEGNRSVETARAKKIKESIMKHGYIHCPIIVNENMEVIDGQGRLEALKSLGLPAEYVVFDGMTINECIALNIYQTGWSLVDYIESFAERGSRSYQFLLHLITKYKELNNIICLNAVTGTTGNNSRIMKKIKAGDFVCTGEQYEKADELLGYTMRFLKTIKNYNKGTIMYICTAIMFAYQLEEVDREKLVDKFEKYYGMDDIPQFIDVNGALKILTMIYNRRNTKDKIYFEVEYDKLLNGKYTWYANKWGNKEE